MDDRQEQSELAAERAEDNRRRSGRDITPRPSSQAAAEAYIARTIHDARNNMAGLGEEEVLRHALNSIKHDLAIAGEENNWVRVWMVKASGMIHSEDL